MVRYIYQDPGWPKFFWDDAKLLPVLSAVRLRQGRLLGQMGQLGFRFKAEAGLENLTAEVIKSSAIEGTIFDPEAVRSSVARQMGLPTANEASAGREIDGAQTINAGSRTYAYCSKRLIPKQLCPIS